MNPFFILGACDPEMLEIVRVLEAQRKPFSFATALGKPVSSKTAYDATGIQGLLPPAHRIVFVECAVLGLRPDEVCDHHNEGDPGYGLPPEQYLAGSSLGQVLAILGLTASHEQRIIAAADHCLRHAYAGRCPGVAPMELAAWREKTRAQFRGITRGDLRGRIHHATLALQRAPRVQVAGESLAWFPACKPLPEELNEASARIGIPFCYARRDRTRCKRGIKSATPRTIEEWMRGCGLHDVYGDPARGFAGGYGS